MSLKHLPFAIFVGLLLLFAIGLTLNPREVPSPLINQPAPDLTQATPLFESDFNVTQLQGKVWLLNVWASWCPSCAAEHAHLSLIDTTIWPLIGLNYRDDRQEALRWLSNRGNPYSQVLFDPDGLTAMDWGVTAAPETFVIDANGKVRYRHTGPLTRALWQDQLQPLLQQLQAETLHAKDML